MSNHPQVRLDFNYMMAEFVGANGFLPQDIMAMQEKALAAIQTFEAERGKGMMGWTLSPYDAETVAQIQNAAEEIRNSDIEHFVVLGIGGSSLGPIAVHQALSPMHYNLLPREKRGGPCLYVEDNVDPERFAALLDILPAEKTIFNVVSKSGNTSETTSQYLIIRDMLQKKLGAGYAKHIVATTGLTSGNLIKMAKHEGYLTFGIPDGVGGRYSEMCAVGLLPAAVCGLDIAALLLGAADMDARCKTTDIMQNPAALSAIFAILAMQKGMNISVMMPYADSLRYISDWYAQLWAESLGKEKDTKGNIVRTGQTPVKALGTTDQHSQLQLYAEGPHDKVVTFIGVDEFRRILPIPQNPTGIEAMDFLCGHTMNELILAEQKATAYALAKAGQPNMTLTLPQVTAHTVGQLLYLFMVQTALTGFMMGIDPFDQPGVEESKNATYALLGRAGFDAKRAELAAQPPQRKEYQI